MGRFGLWARQAVAKLIMVKATVAVLARLLINGSIRRWFYQRFKRVKQRKPKTETSQTG